MRLRNMRLTQGIPSKEYYDWLDANPLYRWRASKNWTLARVAARVGVSISAASRWEDGTSLPAREKAIELEDLTGIVGLLDALREHRTKIP